MTHQSAVKRKDLDFQFLHLITGAVMLKSLYQAHFVVVLGGGTNCCKSLSHSCMPIVLYKYNGRDGSKSEKLDLKTH